MNNTKGRNDNKPQKQKCIVCKRPVVHSDRKFLICLDCLIVKLIQVDKTGELFRFFKKSE